MMQQLFRTPKLLLNLQLPTLHLFTYSSINLKIYEITLNGLQRTRVISAYVLMFLFLWLSAPNHVFAKGVSDEIPENATAKSYGNGWNCNMGYRESKGACTAVMVPDNAYPTNRTYGKGWECKRGFREYDKHCQHIMVPENGYLDYSGTRVKCDRGYLMVNKICDAIKVPANGYLKDSSYGSGWTCERGYRENKTDCVALNIPENAHIGFSGNVWECNMPYIKKKNNCILSIK